MLLARSRHASVRSLKRYAGRIALIEHAAFAERMWFQRTLGQLIDADCDGPLWAHGGFRVGDEGKCPTHRPERPRFPPPSDLAAALNMQKVLQSGEVTAGRRPIVVGGT